MRPSTEPVALATVIAPLLAWLAARYGLDVSPEKATWAAGVILTIGAGLARSAVRTKRTLPDPDAIRGPKVVQAFEPTTYTPTTTQIGAPLRSQVRPAPEESQRPRE